MGFNEGTAAYARFTQNSNEAGIAQVYVIPGSIHVVTPHVRKLMGKPIYPEFDAYEEAKKRLADHAGEANEYGPDISPFAFISKKMSKEKFEILIKSLRDVKNLELRLSGSQVEVDGVLDSIVARLTTI